jgi:hypothetical protein
VVAVRKKSVVRDIDEMRIRPRSHNLAQHGEAAEAGIEDKDGRANWHGRDISWLRVINQLFSKWLGIQQPQH